jgi:MoaA/NifB/PqqE/SkfB family radical SAM enzyme
VTATTAAAIGEAVTDGRLPGRVWLYANYHCNLTCSYCLTESGPRVAARELGPERMLAVAAEAAALGFAELGVTGGETFLLPWLPETLAAMAEHLPVLVLTNGTLFGGRRIDKLAPLVGARVALQISLDRPDPIANDGMRGPANFRKVVEAVPRLVDRGIQVRIATTVDTIDDAELDRLCALHRSLGVADDDHVIRPIIHRGRAVTAGLGVVVGPADLPPELTITADGAFWSPFGPTVRGGTLDTDLLITRTTRPLTVPAGALLRLLGERPPGEDTTLNIR